VQVEKGNSGGRDMKTVLTIAGSDCSGGAGIQADIKTITAHKLYAMSAVTALTAQNTTGVYGVMEVTPGFLGEQLECIFDDIRPDAVKIGMIFGAGLIGVIAKKLELEGVKEVVLDPVMISTSGRRLLAEEAMEVLVERLMPLARVVTPNIPEAEVLSGQVIKTAEDMVRAAKMISQKCQGAVLVKGGHGFRDADDLLYDAGQETWFRGERIDNQNTHGTGCTLSAAIASNLAMGYSLKASVEYAKDYISGALRANLDLGRGNGPLDHTFLL